jgi:Tol biopolymer transport system component
VESSNIWKVPFDTTTGKVTGKPYQITRGSRLATTADVSPDGKWLAFDAFGSGREDIFVIRTDGTGHRQLTDDLYKDRIPRWSPDGGRIGFYSNRSGSYEIWTIELDGSGLQQLTETPGQSVNDSVWSPEGSQIAYYNRSEGISYIFDPNRSWSEQTPLPLPTMDNESLRFEVHTWSPDGLSIAGLVRTDAGRGLGPAVYDLSSKTYQGPLEFEIDNKNGSWLPDSRGVVFASVELYLADRKLQRVQEILSLSPNEILYPSVAPDGRWIFFNRRVREADIWLLTSTNER